MVKISPNVLKPIKVAAGAAILSVGLSQGAQALVIDPASTTVYQSGPETSTAQITAIVAPVVAPATELYKSNHGGSEVGSLAGSYETTFSNTTSNPSDADIEYVGGSIVGPNAWLVVKDGNQNPAWYLFDLTDLGWDGMETLELQNFWPAQGSISHVSLYGTPGTPVSEPAVLGLTLAGLGGLLAVRRKRT